MMRFRLSYDHARNRTELSLGGERWRRKGELSIAQVDRLCRAIALSNGAEYALSSFGFKRVEQPRRRAA